MCLNRDWFSTYKTVYKCVVIMENDVHCKIIGIGSVRIKMLDGTVMILGNVRHISDLKIDFTSLSTIDTKGYK